MTEQEADSKNKGRQIVDGVEKKIANTFPWLKASLGGFWTIFWVIIAFTIEAIVFLVPILLAVAGVIFIIVVVASGDGMIDIPLWLGGSKEKEEKQ